MRTLLHCRSTTFRYSSFLGFLFLGSPIINVQSDCHALAGDGSLRPRTTVAEFHRTRRISLEPAVDGQFELSLLARGGTVPSGPAYAGSRAAVGLEEVLDVVLGAQPRRTRVVVHVGVPPYGRVLVAISHHLLPPRTPGDRAEEDYSTVLGRHEEGRDEGIATAGVEITGMVIPQEGVVEGGNIEELPP